MNLPLEVLNNVLQNLPKKDLKQLRLVCVSLVDKVAPFLFDSVFISRDPLDLDKAVLLLKTFASMFKSVIISPVAFEQLSSRSQYQDRVTTVKSVMRCPPHSRFKEHIKQGYHEYRIVQERSSRPDTEDRMLHLFETVLSNAPCLKQVVITHRRRNTNLTGQELAKYCRYKTCGMPVKMHGIFRLDPFQSTDGFYSPNLNKILHMALTASGPKMVEIVMDHRNGQHPFSAGIDTFVIFDGLLTRPFTALSKLTKLKLHLDKSRDFSPVLFRTGIVAQQLSYAVGLEHLYLGAVQMDDDWQFHVPSKSMFHYLLKGCHFQKLETLVLDSCEMQGEELLPILRKSPDLKELVLCHLSLQEYTWMDLIAKIKEDTQLRILIMDGLTDGGLETTSHYNPNFHYDPTLRPKLSEFVDCTDDINNFYFGDGPNPFASGALEKYIEKWFPNGLERCPPGKSREYMDAWC